MLTSSARRGRPDAGSALVTTNRALVQGGWSSGGIRAQLVSARWQRAGRAIVLHNGPLTRSEQLQVALVNAGPRRALTAFTGLERWGLAGWERDEIHLLVPRGARVTRPADLPLRLHFTDRWTPDVLGRGRVLHRPEHAAVLAAASFTSARPACGVLAAAVQQGLVRPGSLVEAVSCRSRVRHRAALLAAAQDIAGGANAMSEIDLARLCRRAGLPEPVRQAVRRDESGRRRYLDAEWTLPDGRSLVVEVDGALHLVAQRWWNDQLRQNELVLAGSRVLRFPTVVIRSEPELVVDQLRRALRSVSSSRLR